MTTGEVLAGRLDGQVAGLMWILEAASSESLERRPAPDKWSAREHLAHLARYQQHFLERLRAILDTDRPAFRRYRAEDDPAWPAWQPITVGQARERLQVTGGKLGALIRSLSADDLARVGVHPVFGAMTITQWVDFFLFHEGHHAYVIMTLTGARGSEYQV